MEKLKNTPRKRTEISVDILRQLLDYDPITGRLNWKKRPPEMFSNRCGRNCTGAKIWNRRYAGTLALNTPCKDGYLGGEIFAKYYSAHRVIWALENGRWPTAEIDHENGNRVDNRALNLREVDRVTQCRNKAIPKNNTSGVAGVSYNRNEAKWFAFIRGKGSKRISLGYFRDIQDAINARKDAEQEYGYHKNHGRKQLCKN